MERSRYVAEAVRIQRETDERLERSAKALVRRPWRVGKQGEAMAQVMRGCLDDLKSLSPPAGDRADLERHFIQPMEEQVDRLEQLAHRFRRQLRSGRFIMAIRGLAELEEIDGSGDPADDALCVAYGLKEPSKVKGPEERG